MTAKPKKTVEKTVEKAVPPAQPPKRLEYEGQALDIAVRGSMFSILGTLNHTVARTLAADPALTPKKLAKRVGWSKKYLEKVLSGKSDVGLRDVADIGTACCVEWKFTIKPHDPV